MDISKFVNQSGLQKWNGLGYKNSKNRYPQNRLTSVECILDMSPKNIQNGKCISLYNHRIYSPVCRYKTHEAGHGNARGRPHLSIFGNRDADDFRTCQDVDTVWLIL